LLEESHQAARGLLTGARELLDRLVDKLLREETIDQEELRQILGSRPALVETDLDPTLAKNLAEEGMKDAVPST
jgi:hypothetical protein